MLGLIKFLAFIATATILNHQANANHCHPEYDYTCKGTRFRLEKGRGADEFDNLVGKLMTSTHLQPI